MHTRLRGVNGNRWVSSSSGRFGGRDGWPTQAWFWLEWVNLGTDETLPVTSLNRTPERSAEQHRPHSFVRN